MITHRIVSHFREQNWFAVGVEIIVVVLGVYLGIYLNDLQAERQFDRQTDRTFLTLEKELQSDLDRIDEIVPFQEGKNMRTRQAIELLLAETFDAQELSELIGYTIGRNDTLFPNKSAYQTMKTAGYLAAYSGDDLRLQITDLYELYYVRQDVNADLYDKLMFESTQTNIYPYWDAEKGEFIYAQSEHRAVVRNGLSLIAEQGEFYTNYLRETVRPAVVQTLNMLSALDIQ